MLAPCSTNSFCTGRPEATGCQELEFMADACLPEVPLIISIRAASSSDFGTWLQNTAQVLLAYPAVALGPWRWAGHLCAQFSSPLLLGPWAGGDDPQVRWPPDAASPPSDRRSVRGSDGGARVWPPAIRHPVAGVRGHRSGLAFTFALPARNVTVRRARPGERNIASPAFAMDSVSYNLGRAVAPPISVASRHHPRLRLGVRSQLLFVPRLRRSARAGGQAPHRRNEGEPSPSSRMGSSVARQDWRIEVLLLMVAAVTVADDPSAGAGTRR